MVAILRPFIPPLASVEGRARAWTQRGGKGIGTAANTLPIVRGGWLDLKRLVSTWSCGGLGLIDEAMVHSWKPQALVNMLRKPGLHRIASVSLWAWTLQPHASKI